MCNNIYIMVHYIYALSHPITNEVRYIGKTINIKRRYKQHLYDKRTKSYKSSWIISLKSLGLKPIMTIIEECNDVNWEDREIYWIQQYENLTNTQKGGNGGDDYRRYIPEESIEKIRQANIGKVLSEEHKNKLSSKNGFSCIIDDIEYQSIKRASLSLNISQRFIKKRILTDEYQNYYFKKY